MIPELEFYNFFYHYYLNENQILVYKVHKYNLLNREWQKPTGAQIEILLNGRPNQAFGPTPGHSSLRKKYK